MYWIVERTVRDEDSDPQLWVATGRRPEMDNTGRLIQALKDRNIPHSDVRKLPFSNQLFSTDDGKIVTFGHIDEPVFVYGDVSLQAISDEHGWKPGYIDAPDMALVLSHWGEHMLNHDAQLTTLANPHPPIGSFFVRPVRDGKAFPGTLLDDRSYPAWRDNVLDPNGLHKLRPSLEILFSSPKHLKAEWRLMIVDGRVITASQYRDNGKLFYREGAASYVLHYARNRLLEWQPRRAFIMDICEIDDGLKIVEVNSISSAGLYAMHLDSYISAIQNMRFDHVNSNT